MKGEKGNNGTKGKEGDRGGSVSEPFVRRCPQDRMQCT